MVGTHLLPCAFAAALLSATPVMARLPQSTHGGGHQEASATWNMPEDAMMLQHHAQKAGHQGDGLHAQAETNLEKPSAEPYNLNTGTKQASYSQDGQDRALESILGGIKNGFFVESGAHDGEENSNTLWYELNKGWTGLLIEPNRRSFSRLRGRHRRAYAYNGCISPTRRPETLHFNENDQFGHITDGGSYGGSSDPRGEAAVVQALPLVSLLQSINQKTVDFWSLDVEGSEGLILSSTDFNAVEVGVILVEFNPWANGRDKAAENIATIQQVMEKNGFLHLNRTLGQANDNIYVNPRYFEARRMPVPHLE